MMAACDHPDYSKASIARITRTAYEITTGECDGLLSELAQEFGIHIHTLQKWVKAYKEKSGR